MGPGNSDALGNILNMAAAVMNASVGATSGSPTSVDVGGVVLPAYELEKKFLKDFSSSY
jgi:hypothetical protein